MHNIKCHVVNLRKYNVQEFRINYIENYILNKQYKKYTFVIVLKQNINGH